MGLVAAVSGRTSPEMDAQENRVLEGGEDYMAGRQGRGKAGRAGSTWATCHVCMLVAHVCFSRGDGGQGPRVCHSGRDLQTWGRTGVPGQAKGLRIGWGTGEVQGQAVQSWGSSSGFWLSRK